MTTTRRIKRDMTDEKRNELIRHHLEEASTHLGMVKQLNSKEAHILEKIGRILNRVYQRHGGIPH